MGNVVNQNTYYTTCFVLLLILKPTLENSSGCFFVLLLWGANPGPNAWQASKYSIKLSYIPGPLGNDFMSIYGTQEFE